MKKIIFVIWELPQILLSIIISCILKNKTKKDYNLNNENISYTIYENKYIKSFCLSKIFINKKLVKRGYKELEKVLIFQYGLQKLSKIFGIFYIPFILIPLLISKLYTNVILIKILKINNIQAYKKFYNIYPAKLIDKITNTKRFKN